MKENNHGDLEVVEFDTHHIFFELSSRSCSVGQLVSLSGQLIFPTSEEKFEASGKITMIKEIADDQDKICVELHSFDKKKWAEFNQFLNKQQSELDALFRSMRDDE